MKSKDTALAEITLRKYERPYRIKSRDLVAKLCLSIGLLQPGDSRDIIVDVLYSLLKHKELGPKDIETKVVALRKKHKLPMAGIAPSNLRRQVRRLKDMFLIEKINNNYRIAENDKLLNIFKEKIEEFYLKSIRERVGEYFDAVDREFLEKKPKQE